MAVAKQKQNELAVFSRRRGSLIVGENAEYKVILPYTNSYKTGENYGT